MDQAIILAAGDASRLRPLNYHRPKGMILLGGKPLLQWTVKALVSVGIRDIVIVIGVNGEKIQAFFGDGSDFDCSIAYAQQSEPSGTAGAVRTALSHMDKDKETLIVPGHILVEAETLESVATQTDTLLLSKAPRSGEQWVPSVSGDHITGIESAGATAGATRVSTAIFSASAEFFEFLTGADQDVPHLDQVLHDYAKEHDVRAVDASTECARILEPWDLLRLNDGLLDHLPPSEGIPELAELQQPVRIGKNTVVSPTASIIGPVTIGDGCHIGDRTIIGPYVSIRNNTVIGTHCEVRRSIINNNVHVDSRAVIRGSILDDGVECGPGFIIDDDSTPDGPRGCIIGSDASIGSAVLAKAGSVISHGAAVDDRATVNGD